MDAFGHHVARLGAAGIETVAGKPADDVASVTIHRLSSSRSECSRYRARISFAISVIGVSG
jgi:hypothetical protein